MDRKHRSYRKYRKYRKYRNNRKHRSKRRGRYIKWSNFIFELFSDTIPFDKYI